MTRSGWARGGNLHACLPESTSLPLAQSPPILPAGELALGVVWFSFTKNKILSLHSARLRTWAQSGSAAAPFVASDMLSDAAFAANDGDDSGLTMKGISDATLPTHPVVKYAQARP